MLVGPDLLRRAPRLSGALIALASLAGCGATAGMDGDEGWSHGIPRDQPAVVTLENLSYSPPRMIGLVAAHHAAAADAEATLRKSGIKRVPSDRMELLLDELEERGFVASSAPLAEFREADPRLVLRRLTVLVGDERRAFTLPRGPSQAAADRFGALALAVQAMFNETVDFRVDAGSKDELSFYKAYQLLIGAPRREGSDGERRR